MGEGAEKEVVNTAEAFVAAERWAGERTETVEGGLEMETMEKAKVGETVA